MTVKTIAVGMSAAALILGSGAIARADYPAVAFAVGHQNGGFTLTSHAGNTPSEATQKAIAQCASEPGASDCTSGGAVSSGCVSVAFGNYPHFESGVGPTAKTAEAAARARLAQDGPSIEGENPSDKVICVSEAAGQN
jgi:Domain of unknown function (DUF4189)